MAKSPTRLNDVERLALIEQVRRGDRAALNRFLNCNRGLCILAIRPYIGAGRLEYDELLGCAFFGIFEAVLSWDPLQSAFSTHAINRIRWEVSRELQKRRLIHIPRGVSLALPQVRRSVEAYQQRTGGSMPDEIEIAIDTGLPVGTVAECLRARAERFQAYDENAADNDMGNGGAVCPAISQKTFISCEAMEKRIDLQKGLEAVLNDMERSVLRRSVSGLTLEDIGRQHGFTRERARQIYAGAVTKLKRFFNRTAAARMA
ncbi:MAG: sigma-70 family RNA polymerase sigma factor [Chitinivibrionales bacterium]|nr:sigma-70 family RNA polymerase sigma factor [Chitinivibrionales bacterium]